MDINGAVSEPAEAGRRVSLRAVVGYAIVALCAVAAWRFRSYLLVFGLIGGFLAGLVYVPFTILRGLIHVVWGVRCPACGEWGLVQVTCISFGDRFYRCDFCGLRCKRADMESPWLDASGKEDDDMYKPIPVYGPGRRREARTKVLTAVGGLGAFAGALVVGALVEGPVGKFIRPIVVPLAFVSLWFFLWVSRRKARADRPIRPPLWDGEIDP